MTDIDLQKTIRNELQKMKLKVPADEGADGKKTKWQEIPIYLQNKPYSHDEAYDYGDPLCDDQPGEKRMDNYILVVIGPQKTDERGQWSTEIQLIFQIQSMRDERDGELILANLMNKIDYEFTKKGILAEKYEIEKEKSKDFNPVCPENYYQSAYTTHWKLPNITQEMEVKGLI